MSNDSTWGNKLRNWYCKTVRVDVSPVKNATSLKPLRFAQHLQTHTARTKNNQAVLKIWKSQKLISFQIQYPNAAIFVCKDPPHQKHFLIEAVR